MVGERLEQPAQCDNRLTLEATLRVPKALLLGSYDVGIELMLGEFATRLSGAMEVPPADAAPPFEGAGVWARLGDPNSDRGIVQRDHADGVTTPVTVAGVSARKTAPGVDSHMYMYFDIEDRFLFDIKGTEVEIGIEYLDQGTGNFRVQYDSHNPTGDLGGAYMNAPLIPLQDTGEWKWATVKLSDARFANRQNDGTDFRLTAGTAELVIRTVYVRVVDLK